MVQPLRRRVWRFLKKLKIEISYNPIIPLLDIYPEKTAIQKDTCTDFPGGSAAKNSPTTAGNMGSVPALGRFYMPRGN